MYSLSYEPFYGLHEKPFSLSADPRFLFRSPAHEPSFQEILTGIRRREGLIVLTGEIGTGKTTLCRSVVEHLDRRTFASFVADPFVSREDLLKTLLVDFGVISMADLTSGRFNGASRSDLSYPLYEFLDSLVPLQAFAVVFIDEAQNLSLPLLEEIRILSELERREKLLQVVLVGQPELRTNLKLPQMRQVDQRVSVRCELTPLNAGDVAGYVNHRLQVAGRGRPAVEFTSVALDAVHLGAAGVPRLINRICDRALHHAHLARASRVEAHLVFAALDDLGLEAPRGTREPAPIDTEWHLDAGPAVAAAPEPVPAPAAAPTLPVPDTAQSGIAFGGELDFGEEKAPALASARPEHQRRGRQQRSTLATAAAVLAICAAIGAPAWYARAQAVDVPALTPALPPRLQLPAPKTIALPEAAESLPHTARPADAARPWTAGTAGTYSILVASFRSPQAAERVVDELTHAGFGAHVVDRGGGTDRAIFKLVMIGGYTSALDVQRDLQRIRALPGGYTDARIVDRQ